MSKTAKFAAITITYEVEDSAVVGFNADATQE